mmetsp:Transcript_6186/g.9723  ORF Transcript_6186/g.9723 Transcript_6186/m.9723 type:complete len:387 (-) Transcript_6186:2110-3270(-)
MDKKQKSAARPPVFRGLKRFSKKNDKNRPFDSARDLYVQFRMTPSCKKRTIKVDLCPDVNAETAKEVFMNVTRLIGFSSVHEVSDSVLMVNYLSSHSLLCGPKCDTHYEFTVMQELMVRDYGNGSAKYVFLVLTLEDTFPRLVQQGSSSWNSLLSQGLAKSFGKKLKVSRKGVDLLIEEIIGRWRATLFQGGHALEAARLENSPDSPWQSLDPDEVDYEDSDEDGSFRRRHSESTESCLPLPPPVPVSSARPKSLELPRPKSALKFPCDRLGKPHDRKKTLSVKFSSEGNQVRALDISKQSREARMAIGCRATNKFGHVRPLTSIRTGQLIFLAQESVETETKQSSCPPAPVQMKRRHSIPEVIEINPGADTANNTGNNTSMAITA